MTDQPSYRELERKLKSLEAENEQLRLAKTLPRESEERSKTVPDSGFGGICQLDTEGNVVYLSPSFGEVFGYTREEVLGMGFKALFSEMELKKAIEVFSRAVTGEEYQLLELSSICKDGSPAPVEVNVSPTWNNNEIVGVQVVLKDISRRKAAEEMVLKREKHYRNYFDKALVGLFRSRLSDGLIIETNTKAAETIDLSVEDVVGKVRLEDYYRIPGQRDRLIEYLRQYGEVHDFEIDLILHNGRNVILSVSVKAYPEEGVMEGVVVDVTARKQAEKELRYRRTAEESVSKASGMLVGVDNVDYNAVLGIMGEVVAVNRAYIFQVSEDGLTMRNSYEWCAPGTVPEIQTLQDLDTEGFQWWIGQIRNHKNIVIRNVDDILHEALAEYEFLVARDVKSVVTIPIWSKGKKLLGFLGFDDTQKTREWYDAEIEALQIVGDMISNDLERRRFAHDLEFERKQLLSIFDSINEYIYISDPRTYEILYVNKSMRTITSEDVVGGKCYKEFQGFDEPCEFCTNQIILDRKPKSYRWERYNPKMGKLFILLDQIIKWPDGRDVRLEFAADITDRKRLEERTQQAQKMEAIGTLAGGVAHDFNNILSGIFGYTQLLQLKVSGDNTISRYVNGIHQAGMRAKDLVQQILTFSRQKKQESKPMRIQSVVIEALKLIQSTLPSTITISSDVQADCGLIRGDQTQIHQIIMNLCTNAYHAMEESGGQLTVTLKELELSVGELKDPTMEPGLYACLSVLDTGTGIEEHILERIFDPYYTTKTKEKGTGMGLAVTHGIVKGHGGQIDVNSSPGKGSEFCVLLPIIDAVNPGNKVDRESLMTGVEHVLLIDDQRNVLEVEEQLIQELGYRVTTRSNSLEALEKFREAPDQFDIVITDMTMPNMTGDQLAAELIKIRPDVPMLLCTGFSEQMSETKARSIGFKGFLPKPLIMKELSRMIRIALDGD